MVMEDGVAVGRRTQFMSCYAPVRSFCPVISVYYLCAEDVDSSRRPHSSSFYRTPQLLLVVMLGGPSVPGPWHVAGGRWQEALEVNL